MSRPPPARAWALIVAAWAVTMARTILAWAGGLGAALVIGAIAGLLPALQAARMAPTEALWSV